MLRAVMYSLMAISNEDTSVLPDPVVDAAGKSVYWVATPIPDELALRPNFAASWTKNKSWLPKFLAKVRRDGNSLYPSCRQEVIDALSDKEISQRGSRTTFKHLKEKYAKQSNSAEEKDLEKQLKRWEVRKGQKAAKRTAVRDQYPALQDTRYDFIFHTAFQSTDYSSDITSDSAGGSLDEGENESAKIKTLKSWPPLHRDQNYIELVDDITARVKLAESKKPGKKAGNKYIMLRSRTKRRQVRSIPRPVDGPKQLSCFIDEAWLDDQPSEFKKGMAPFVFDSGDEGYESSWEDFPVWEALPQKGKGKGKGKSKK
ncbi:hypothetical protein C8R46DRAFT_1145322 [Mycena filopes]|nr:hypothetical protein C8R46DRAFT_1145322 [Mycena filopes]